MLSAPSQAQDKRQDQPEVPDPGRAGSGRKWRWVAFGVVITAAAMDLLDSTIAQVAAPTIRRELGGSYAVIEWVTAAYALAMAVGLLTGGRLGDIFGRRRMLLTGMAGFVAASAACAAAGTAGELIAARAAARQIMSGIALTGWNVLDEARAMLRAAVAGAPTDGWQRPTPCSGWNVTQVLQHAALDQRVWEAMLAGTEMPGENPFAPSGQLGAEPLAYAEAALDASVRAWTAVGEDAAPLPTQLPQGEMAPAAAAGAAALDAAIHAWDIAMATGQGSPLTPELARALTPVAQSIVEPLRQYGAYAPALEPSAGADNADALLCYLGRRPDWTA